MGKIRLLAPEFVNQIAAGEVVERPASVVKELVENALDAGATRIEVQVTDGGRNLRVADNGCGMGADDLQLAFCNHATSKVQTLDDLFAIQTLGFRGEALASVAAIAKLTCISRPEGAEMGMKASVKASGDVVLTEAGCARGTIMQVEDLFYNVPARLKFLKRPQTELSHIQEMMQLLALSHPDVSFTLQLEGATALQTTGQGDLSRTVQEVFSLGSQETLLPVFLSDPDAGYTVTGLASTPNVTRSSRKWLMTFVNGRAVRCPILGKAVESAYQSMATPGKYPIAVVFLTLPPEEVDVNVHPTKREVRYQHPNTLFSFVRRAVESALTASPVALPDVAVMPTTPSAQAMGTSVNRNPGSGGISSGRAIDSSSGWTRQDIDAGRREPRTAPADSLNRAAMTLQAPMEGLMSETAVSPLPQVPDWRVIGQLARTFILLETAEGLLIVDQHIASERVQFERFMTQAEQAGAVSQPLVVPLVLPVTPTQHHHLEAYQATLASLGFAYEITDGGVSFAAVPSLYNPAVLKTSLVGLLHHLEETGEIRLNTDDVIATAACHSAVRAGDPLNLEQMQRIITQWFACQRPWTCPHGRPVSHTLTHGELMGFFDRPSLPLRR